MGLADRLKAKYIERLDALIATAGSLPMERHSERTSYNYLSGQSTVRHFDLARQPEFIRWRTSCIAVLDLVVPATSLLRTTVEAFHGLGCEPTKIQFAIGFLRSVRDELAEGSLDSLARRIEAEILSDYLEQATDVLAATKGEPSHIAAAVIVGAALERSLRALCLSLEPPEPVAKENGQPLGMNALIDALKKRQMFNEMVAKDLRTWTTLRNHAAHGDFDAFDRLQVERMVTCVGQFVRERVA